MNYRKDQLSNLSDEELISLRISIHKEMRSRGIKFSVGELGEKIAIDFFNETSGLSNLMAAPTGAKNVDALSRDGDRYSIKTIQKAKKTGTIYPDRDNPDKQLFEYLLLVQLNHSFEPKRITRFSWANFLEIRAWDKRMNAWYIPVSKARLAVGENFELDGI
tara:strand:- start:58 stop:543 length:486 start_codon:yes stop_codon:yes gene_type:complete